jgi:subtilisin family serine protease
VTLVVRTAAALALLALLGAVAGISGASGAHAGTRAVPAPLTRERAAIPDSYIVSLAPGADPDAVAKEVGASPRYVYRKALLGFAARLTPAQLTRVRSMDAVRGVEQDATVSVPQNERATPDARAAAGSGTPWGLERIANRAPGATRFDVRATGAGVTAYIVDSGIDFSHPEFGGRAVPGVDEVGDGRNGADCSGHGTHVAGTVGGAHTGVARAVRLVSVRVLDCDARGPNSGIIAALNWVAANAHQPAVANISLGGGYSPSLNASIDGLAAAGVFPVVAAGNDDVSACVESPASAPDAFSVGATDQYDRRAPFSDYGSCVNLNAPGVDVVSTYLGGTYTAMSGTSMAAPHVTGIAALYEDTHGATPFTTLKSWLIDNATPNVPVSAPWGTPHLLAYTGGL